MIKKWLTNRKHTKLEQRIAKKQGHTLYCNCKNPPVLLNDPGLEQPVVQLLITTPKLTKDNKMVTKYVGKVVGIVSNTGGSTYSNIQPCTFSIIFAKDTGKPEVSFAPNSLYPHNVHGQEEKNKALDNAEAAKADLCLWARRCPFCGPSYEKDAGRWEGFEYGIAPCPITLEMLDFPGFTKESSELFLNTVCNELTKGLIPVTTAAAKELYDY